MSQQISEFTKKVLSQTDIVDVVQSKMSLKKSGSNYQGLCPFHNENTPSFSVNASKQFFYCFGCQASGDAINFIMRHDNLSFIDALEILARRLGLALPERSSDQPKIDRTIFKNLRDMALVCRGDLIGMPEDYLRKRGIETNTIKKFHIGYCGPQYLQWFDSQKRIRPDLLLSGGIASQSGANKITPKFFKRLMFPIQDSVGKVIGFGGRTLDDVPPKYLNSPETDFFKKRQVLYGLYQFRQLKSHEVIVVEGYMDCLALHSRNIPGVVACLGTAFTLQHWYLLKKYVQKVIFCFDGDRAGKAAAWKSLLSIFPGLDPTINVRFLFLPDKHDPDSFISQHGRPAFLQKAASAESWDTFFLHTLTQQYPIHNVEGKAGFLESAKTHIDTIKNHSLQTILQQEVSKRLELKSVGAPIAPKSPTKVNDRSAVKRLTHSVIGMLCKKNSEMLAVPMAIDNMIHDPLIDLINGWLSLLREHPNLSGTQLLSQHQGSPVYAQCVQILHHYDVAYHAAHVQIEILSLRIELADFLIRDHLTQDQQVPGEHKSLLQALIVNKKNLEQERHDLRKVALLD